ncbi:MAG: PDZ domain-containing protein, partial [Acidimicrobiales bacterium]
QLYQVEPGSPAAAAGLRCNDVVIAVNGAPVRTAEDLVQAIHEARPGQSVTIGLRRTVNGKAVTEDLVAKLTGTPAISGQGPAKPSQAFLGVVAESDTTYVFPFDVSIHVGNIGGPSAGLALTLGLLDVLSNGRLTGGHRIAATGTISLDGSVGVIGGVAQKAVAVRRAGAQMFLVPPQNLEAARSEAGSMKVLAVSSLHQALDDLAAIGGRIPAPTPATPTAAR